MCVGSWATAICAETLMPGSQAPTPGFHAALRGEQWEVRVGAVDLSAVAWALPGRRATHPKWACRASHEKSQSDFSVGASWGHRDPSLLGGIPPSVRPLPAAFPVRRAPPAALFPLCGPGSWRLLRRVCSRPHLLVARMAGSPRRRQQGRARCCPRTRLRCF